MGVDACLPASGLYYFSSMLERLSSLPRGLLQMAPPSHQMQKSSAPLQKLSTLLRIRFSRPPYHFSAADNLLPV